MKEKTENRDKILIAAKKEFSEKGFSGARMGAISKRAGVNQALLHYYFENKEKLYMELLHRLFGTSKSLSFQEVLDTEKMTPPEALYSAIYLLVNIHFNASDPEFNRIIAREITEKRDSLKSIMKDYFVPAINSMEEIIIKGRKEGYFETENPLFTVLQMISFILSFQSNRETYSETGLYEKLSGKNITRDLFDFLVDHTFKALSPQNKKGDIPAVSEDLIRSLDRVVENIREGLEWREEEG